MNSTFICAETMPTPMHYGCNTVCCSLQDVGFKSNERRPRCMRAMASCVAAYRWDVDQRGVERVFTARRARPYAEPVQTYLPGSSSLPVLVLVLVVFSLVCLPLLRVAGNMHLICVRNRYFHAKTGSS
jgi:hypothetical protein